MRAVAMSRYGGPEVLRLEEVARPEPAEGEILVRVYSSAVNRSDTAYRSAHPWFARALTGLLRPRWRTAGSEFAGVVESVGASVSEFRPGDRVFGESARTMGAHAEFIRVAADGAVAPMPDGMTFEEAGAVVDGFILSLMGLRRVRIQAGERVLVYGASGSIGTAGVQIAKHYGAHVTAVCATPNLELARSLGADEVIDYTREDFARNGQTYDVILDAVGKRSYFQCRRSLAAGGRYIATEVGFLYHLPFVILWTRFFGSRRVVLGIPVYRKGDVLLLKELIEAGRYRAVVDRSYPLDEIVEAHRYVDSAQKVGNVAITIVPDGGEAGGR